MANEYSVGTYNAQVVYRMYVDEYIAMMECKREQHRVKMVDFRQKKKSMNNRIRSEHRRLEREMKELLFNLRKEASKCTKPSRQDTTYLLREIIEEKEALRHQNTVLHDEIQRREMFRRMLENGRRDSSKTEGSLLPVRHGDVGWWVHFTNGASSFLFYPFFAEEVEATMDPMCHDFIDSLSSIPVTGTLFGWNVHRQVNFRGDSDMKPVSSRMLFTKRVHCSIETAYEVAYVRERDLRPLLLTPLDWSCNESGKVNTKVLQDFRSTARLMLHSIPGSTYLHYMFVARTAQWQLNNGKRRMGFSMVATDSKPNNRMRDAMGQNDVEWLTEGWAYFMITEVDANTIDVVYDHCVGCDNEIHADKFFIQLTQFVYRWEQAVAPSYLLAPNCVTV